MTNEEKLLWMTTVAESSPEEICAFLDQVEHEDCSSFSTEQGWKDLQKAHPQCFPTNNLHWPKELHRFRSAAALLAITLGLSAAVFLSPGKSVAPSTHQSLSGYASLYSMISLDVSPSVTPIRAELPVEVFLSEGPAELPTSAELYCISKNPDVSTSEDVITSNVDGTPFLLFPQK